MILFNNNEECYGCSACYNICPKKAIIMKEDSEGFKYPVIDDNKCIKCNMCKKTCPYGKDIVSNERKKYYEFDQLYYAVKNKDRDIVVESSSGGIFTALAKYILTLKGNVYGVSFDSGFKVLHKKGVDENDLKSFRGSKYVQSDMNEIIKEIEIDILEDKHVLFSGTPCQVAGLLNYFRVKKIPSSKLITCDFVCHGVSSPLVWKDYISYIEKKYNSKLIEFSFRNKTDGWANNCSSAKFDRDLLIKFNNKSSYMNLYKNLFITRPSCFQCQFTSYNRLSDITIADFWNIDKYIIDFNDDKGVSLCMINTNKGLEVFDNIKENLIFRETCKEAAWQPHLEYPVAKQKKRFKFWAEYKNNNFAFIIKKYGSGTLQTRLIKQLTPIIKKMGLYIIAGKLYNRIIRR